MKAFILALQFLTRFYIPIQVDFSDKNLRHSFFFFPWVGLLLGYLLTIPLKVIPNQDISGLVILVLWISFTGGMHLDGLSDTADGFFSNRDRNRVLEIMKDSRVGAFGVISLILVLLAKYVLLSKVQLTPYSLPGILAGARLANALVVGTFPSARPGGMGEMFQKTKPLPYILVSGILFLVYLVLTDKKLIFVLLIQLLVVGLTSLVSLKKIQGVTGDIYGANVELAEAFALLVLGLI